MKRVKNGYSESRGIQGHSVNCVSHTTREERNGREHTPANRGR